MSHRAPELSPLPQHGAWRGGGPRLRERQAGEGRGLWELQPAPVLLWPLTLSLVVEMHFTFISLFSLHSPRCGVISLPFSPYPPPFPPPLPLQYLSWLELRGSN